MRTLTNFLSSGLNLLILQCILYFVLGYILYPYFHGMQLFIIYLIILAINFITHIRSVGKGMMMREMMNQDFTNFIKDMERMAKKNEGKDEE